MALGGAVIALFGFGFALATIAEALSIVLDRWLALLIVTAGLFGLAGLLALLGLAAIKRGTPPVPEQAIQEAKLTTEALKSNGSH
jgi:sulfite exporter TauE/SafE